MCSQCLAVCKTCSDGTTCSSCPNNLVISGSICDCVSPLLLNPTNIRCNSCTYFDSNCQTCSYDPSFDASSPNPVVCSVPSPGYYLINNVTAPCGSYCSSCIDSSTCTTCEPTFSISSGSCVCSPLDYTNTNPPTCDNCSNIIPGCNICARSTTTKCQVCISNYYPSPSSYPTTSCIACPITCSSCTDSNTCTGCMTGLSLTLNTCYCDSPNFLSATLTC